MEVWVQVPPSPRYPNIKYLNKNQNNNMSNFKVNDKIGVRATLTHYLDVLAKDNNDSQTEEELALKISYECGVDLTIWQIDSYRITGNAWTVNGKFGSGKDARFEEAVNGQVKCIIDYVRIAPDNKNEFKDDLLNTLRNKSPRRKKKDYIIKDGTLLLNDIPDLHLGRLAYGKETGDNYDINIASKRFDNANDYFYNEAEYVHKRHPIERQLFIIGNDFFNYDYAKPFPQTTNGTAQESDVRFQKMFNMGSNLVIKRIEIASELSPITIIIVPGNHDEQLSFYLGEVLNAYFHNNPNVIVNVSPKLREYYQHGKVMLGFSHGKYETFERLFSNMVFEEMKMWADTKFKYFYTGHKHSKETRIKLINPNPIKDKDPKASSLVTQDFNGVLFDKLSSLTSSDYYESSRGYIHIKMAESFLFSKEQGKLQSFNYQLPLSIHNQ